MHTPQRNDIDHRVLKLMVGLVGLFLASATSFFSSDTILSISQSHCYGGWARDFFVGTMFAIAAFMAAYNGFSRKEMWVAKVTALAAVGVAWFPTRCPTQDEIIPGAHVISSVIMFLMLAMLCRIFYLRAKSRGLVRANRRAVLYAVCGFAILIAMGLVAIDHFLGSPVKSVIPRLEFYCQQVALIAFGVAWLAASHIVPWLTAPEERWLGRK
jgi:hypothetical protein